MKPITLLLALFALAFVTACQNTPGESGQYATKDHGDLNRPGRALPE
jgi:hypothetical protein